MFGRADTTPSEPVRASQEELQDALLRFHGRLTARLDEAFAPFAKSEDEELRLRAARDRLMHEASALDIAIGPVPESNLLDMVTFVELVSEACLSRWSVDVYGERGAGVAAALRAASVDVWQVARTLLTPDEEEKLRKVIQEWKEENPEVTLVATVRLPSFSSVTAQQGSSRAEASARGLFSDVHKGVKAADMARLLGERALFAAQRLPFLARLQATIAVREVVQEVADKLPVYGAAIADAAAARVAEHARRVVVTGALATAGVVVLAAIAYAIVR